MAKAKISTLKDKTILLGVSGSIAVYKSVDLASKLKAEGAKVFVMMTENATKLVGPKTFEAITGNPVFTNLWSSGTEYPVSHITLPQQADIIVVAPATANIVAKTANGIADDILSSTLCAGWNKPILFAPAMNNNMWHNPAVQFNIKSLEEMGIRLVGPGTGKLACGTKAVGRMSEPEDILKAVIKIMGGKG